MSNFFIGHLINCLWIAPEKKDINPKKGHLTRKKGHLTRKKGHLSIIMF